MESRKIVEYLSETGRSGVATVEAARPKYYVKVEFSTLEEAQNFYSALSEIGSWVRNEIVVQGN